MLPVDQASQHHEDHVPLREIVRRPEVVALFAACFLMALAHGPYNTFYSIHLVETATARAGSAGCGRCR